MISSEVRETKPKHMGNNRLTFRLIFTPIAYCILLQKNPCRSVNSVQYSFSPILKTACLIDSVILLKLECNVES